MSPLMHKTVQVLAVCCALMVYPLNHVKAAADVELDVVVKDGDPAPGTTGQFDLSAAFVDNAAATAIDNSAKVWFFTASNEVHPSLGKRKGIWSSTGTFTDVILVDGQELAQFLPDAADCNNVGPTCGMMWNTQAHFHLTSNGEVTLRATREDVTGSTTFLSGANTQGLLPMLISSVAPTFPFTSFLALRTETGEFLASEYAGNKPYGQPNGGLEDWLTPFIGGAAPFIADPVTIDAILGTYATTSGVTFGFNQAGDRMFVAQLSDGSEALYYDPLAAGASKLLVRTGDAAAGINLSEIVEISKYNTVGTAANARINDSGQGYFWGSWRRTDLPINNNNLPRAALWRFSGSSNPAMVMSEYLNPATDRVFATSEFANTAFDDMTVPNIAPNGDIYFYAIGRDVGSGNFPDYSDERQGLWRAPADGGPPQLILRKTTSDNPGSSLPNGPNVPGTKLPGGERFTGFGPDIYGLDEHGHLVFSTQDALYAEDQHGYRLVIKKDQEIEIAPGDIRTVSQFRVNTQGHVSGLTQAYRNDRLAFRVLFDNGSRAILRTTFLAPPPPPKLIGLEAIQVVQDWENSVSLFNGKKTLVRAHIRDTNSDIHPVQLRVYNSAGIEYPFSPLPAEAPAGLAFVGPDSVMKRDKKWASANFTLPTEVTQDTSATVVVRIFEDDLDCQTTAGPVAIDCSMKLNFTEPGVPQIKVISLNYKDNGVLKKVERLTRMNMAERLISAYPIAKLDWTDAEVFYGSNLNEGSAKAHLRKTLAKAVRLRVLDKCSTAGGCKRMYYTAIRAYRGAGLAKLDGYAGSGYAARNPKLSRHVQTHEIGHNLGRFHSVADPTMGSPPVFPLNPDGQKVGPCGSTTDAGNDHFPYVFPMADLTWKAALGPLFEGDDKLIYGWDSSLNLFIDPEEFFDVMSYCQVNPIHFWPSIHTYHKLAAAITSRYPSGGALFVRAPAMDYWVLTGSISQTDISIDPLLRIDDAQPPDVSPAGNWEAQILNGSNVTLDSTTFEPQALEVGAGDPIVRSFIVALPAHPDGQRIRILDAAGVLVKDIVASGNAPAVNITSPNGGENLADETTIVTWTASDLDGDPLTHAVQYSANDGLTWQSLITDTTDQQLEVSTQTLTGSSQARFRVITTDGFYHTIDDSNAVFTVPDSPPTVAINSPGEDSSFYSNDAINFSAMAFDTEDGTLSGNALVWSSSLDGNLGSGETLATSAAALSTGTHTITATGTDTNAGEGSAQVVVHIAQNPPAMLAELGVELVTGFFNLPFAAEPFEIVAKVDHQGPDAVSDGLLTIDVSLQALAGHPAPSALITDLDEPDGWSCQVSGLTIECQSLSLQAYSDAELSFLVTPDKPVELQATANITSATVDPYGGNNSSVIYVEVDTANRVFEDGFEN